MKKLNDLAIRKSLAKRIALVRPDSPRQWGKMTPHEMLCHLTDSFRVLMGEKAVSRQINFLQRHVIRYLALYSAIPWPKGVETRPEVKQGAGGTPPDEFETDRKELLQIMERFTASSKHAPHPTFGPLTDGQRHRWGYLHVDHHLRQFGV